MPMMRVPKAATSTTAQGTVSGELTVLSTVGFARNAFIGVSHASGGWNLRVVYVVDATHLVATWADDGTLREHPNRMDLSVIPTSAVVMMAEQWVQDLWSDDAPSGIAIPVKTV